MCGRHANLLSECEPRSALNALVSLLRLDNLVGEGGTESPVSQTWVWREGTGESPMYREFLPASVISLVIGVLGVIIVAGVGSLST